MQLHYQTPTKRTQTLHLDLENHISNSRAIHRTQTSLVPNSNPGISSGSRKLKGINTTLNVNRLTRENLKANTAAKPNTNWLWCGGFFSAKGSNQILPCPPLQKRNQSERDLSYGFGQGVNKSPYLSNDINIEKFINSSNEQESQLAKSTFQQFDSSFQPRRTVVLRKSSGSVKNFGQVTRMSVPKRQSDSANNARTQSSRMKQGLDVERPGKRTMGHTQCTHGFRKSLKHTESNQLSYRQV